MINATAINSAKEAPPKGKRKDVGPTQKGRGLTVFGGRCAACGAHFNTTAGTKFKMIGGKRRRVCKADPLLRDPTEGIDNLKVQKAPPDPFDPDEVEVILATLRDKHGEQYADYFEFAFFAGLRPSEQIALLWQDVDLRSGTVKVRRSRVLAKDKERTKTAYEREVELNARASAVIERQRGRTQLVGEHVFRNPSTGRPWNDEQEQRKVWVIALRAAKIRYRPPKECRDTSVTMALMAGANPVWVANQHGHSVQVMMKDYAKWIPKADRGANLAAVNKNIAASTAESTAELWENSGKSGG